MQTALVLRMAAVFVLLCGMCVCCGRSAPAEQLPGGPVLDTLARRLLGASQQELATFKESQRRGLMEIVPVHLPIDPPGDCNHYGWPVATMAGDTIIIMHRRIPGHTGPSTAAGRTRSIHTES